MKINWYADFSVVMARTIYKSSAVVGGGQPAFRVYVRVCLSGALALQANVYMKNHYRLPSVVCCTRYIKLYI